jgi:hypothetical protein
MVAPKIWGNFPFSDCEPPSAQALEMGKVPSKTTTIVMIAVLTRMIASPLLKHLIAMNV